MREMQSFKQVNIPLTDTGAGRISVKVSYSEDNLGWEKI